MLEDLPDRRISPAERGKTDAAQWLCRDIILRQSSGCLLHQLCEFLRIIKDLWIPIILDCDTHEDRILPRIEEILLRAPGSPMKKENKIRRRRGMVVEKLWNIQVSQRKRIPLPWHIPPRRRDRALAFLFLLLAILLLILQSIQGKDGSRNKQQNQKKRLSFHNRSFFPRKIFYGVPL